MAGAGNPVSLWQVQCQRKQAAAARDMKNVHDRLGLIDIAISTLSETIEALVTKVASLTSAFPCRVTPRSKEMDSRDDMDEFAKGIERIELLLLRTSLEDFKILDADVTGMMPKMAPRINAEPAAPEKVQASKHSNNELSFVPRKWKLWWHAV